MSTHRSKQKCPVPRYVQFPFKQTKWDSIAVFLSISMTHSKKVTWYWIRGEINFQGVDAVKMSNKTKPVNRYTYKYSGSRSNKYCGLLVVIWNKKGEHIILIMLSSNDSCLYYRVHVNYWISMCHIPFSGLALQSRVLGVVSDSGIHTVVNSTLNRPEK